MPKIRFKECLRSGNKTITKGFSVQENAPKFKFSKHVFLTSPGAVSYVQLYSAEFACTDDSNIVYHVQLNGFNSLLNLHLFFFVHINLFSLFLLLDRHPRNSFHHCG